MNRFCLPSRALGLLVLVLCWSQVSIREAAAQAGDTVDGAVWRFSLNRVGGGPGPKKLRGACRINKLEMFQRESESPERPKDRKPQEWNRKVGGVEKVKRAGDDSKVVWTITDIRAFDDERSPHTLNGTIRASIDKKGHWSGVLIDGDGRHWDFNVQRIQE